MPADASVDLLYLACNRLEFTRETFQALAANTNWALVRELFVMDDGSIDGTAEWLQQASAQIPAAVRFVRTQVGSPVTAMSEFIRMASAPVLAKTDNDAMLPPRWLENSMAVLDRHPGLSLLGIEAMYPHEPEAAVRSYTPAQFISGLGLYRRSAFARSCPTAVRKWFGLEEWQMYQPTLTRGWITPALPVFLLDRIPFEPWSGFSRTYVARGWQRSWPKYDPACTLWQWRWPASTIATPATPVRFLCVMRVKNEERHLGEALSAALALCDRALVFDDHSTDGTVAIARSLGDRVDVIESPFPATLDEARDKNYMLERLVRMSPEWVLWIDGDEVLERSAPEAIRSAIARYPDAAGFSLRVSYLWDHSNQVRVDGIFGAFRRPSLFKLRGQRVDALQFRCTPGSPNLHCGNHPDGLSGALHNLDVRLKHYGYMLPEQRRAKHEWYTRIDPDNDAEDRYRHLAGAPGARYAPGPPQFAPWRE
jgi:glycosyltransferase involved in cell wall biosynthesis